MGVRRVGSASCSLRTRRTCSAAYSASIADAIFAASRRQTFVGPLPIHAADVRNLRARSRRTCAGLAPGVAAAALAGLCSGSGSGSSFSWSYTVDVPTGPCSKQNRTPSGCLQVASACADRARVASFRLASAPPSVRYLRGGRATTHARSGRPAELAPSPRRRALVAHWIIAVPGILRPLPGASVRYRRQPFQIPRLARRAPRCPQHSRGASMGIVPKSVC